jgi:mRNA interferase RelE/StbE
VASYRVLIKPSAVKELEGLPRKDRRRIAERIRALGAAPRPPGTVKLAGGEKYRVRQGPYRIVYSISDSEQVLLVVKVGHRREVYRSDD